MGWARDDSVEALHFLAADAYAFAWVETFLGCDSDFLQGFCFANVLSLGH